MSVFKKYLYICLILYSFTVLGQNDKDLDLDLIQENDQWRLYIKNISIAPLEVVIRTEVNDSIVAFFVLNSSEDTTLMTLEGTSRAMVAKEFNATYDVRNYFGVPSKVNPNLEYIYALPFGVNKKYEVSQGFRGKASHNTVASKYAIDFVMPIGEPIHAARGGLVVKVINHYKKAGGKAYRYKANKVLILHDDGTVATYAHLNYQGTLVEEGDRVKKGQHIGYSGNTGETRGPHLHFVVRKGGDIAIPVFFEGHENKELKRGKRYKRK